MLLGGGVRKSWGVAEVNTLIYVLEPRGGEIVGLVECREYNT